MSDIIMKNIDALCRIQDKKKGDLEKYLGHSAGYLAGKEDGNKLTWEQLQKVCFFFGIEINTLITLDLSWEAEKIRLEKEKNELVERLESIEKELEYVNEQRNKVYGEE